MCHFAMGLTHSYKTTVFFTFITIIHEVLCILHSIFMCVKTEDTVQLVRSLPHDAMQARSLLSRSVCPSVHHIRGSRQNE